MVYVCFATNSIPHAMCAGSSNVSPVREYVDTIRAAAIVTRQIVISTACLSRNGTIRFDQPGLSVWAFFDCRALILFFANFDSNRECLLPGVVVHKFLRTNTDSTPLHEPCQRFHRGIGCGRILPVQRESEVAFLLGTTDVSTGPRDRAQQRVRRGVFGRE